MKALFLFASFLTDPICNAREEFWLGKMMKKISYIKVVFWGVTGGLMAPFGIAIRFIGSLVQQKPYLFLRGVLPERNFDRKQLVLATWNVCFVPGGYAVTDGGVFPWKARIQQVIEKILETDADVACLLEVIDMVAAEALFQKLRTTYSHFYFNIGPKAIGVSSGLFVASKFKIDDPIFLRFPKEHLVGRTKNAAKGVFSFNIGDIRIFLTHLQHSEECMHPTYEEVQARKHQMRIIMDQIDVHREEKNVFSQAI